MLILIPNFISICVSIVNSSPPPHPIKCSIRNSNCTITNSYGNFPDRRQYRAGEVAFPNIEDKLITIMAVATAAKRKMNVVTRFSHSIPKLVCPDGENRLLISTKYLNKTLKFDLTAMTMTVESGVMLRQLIGEATKVGLALSHASYWWGLTVGGLLGTGAHGSSLWKRGSCVHDYVDCPVPE